MYASCCDGSAAKGTPRSRQLAEWRSIAWGSSGAMTTRSTSPTSATSICAASAIAPGKKVAIWAWSRSVVQVKRAVARRSLTRTWVVSTPWSCSQPR